MMPEWLSLYVLLEMKQSIFWNQSGIILRIEHNMRIFRRKTKIARSIKCQFY